MIKDWWSFTAERFPLRATLPLSAVLGAGALAERVWEPALAARAFGTVFLVLLGARIADDLADLDRDRASHPERGLASGRIPVRSMAVALALCLVAALALNVRTTALGILVALSLGSGAFHALRRRVPMLLRTAFVNLPFLAIPLYGELLGSVALSARGVSAGLFLWLSAMGHEYGHSLGEQRSGYTERLSRAAVARLGAAFYGAALAAGAMLAMRSASGALPVVLVGWALLIGALCLRLLRDSRPENGRALYVPGFLFVLVPAGAAFAS